MTYYITLSKHYSEKGNSTPAKTSTRFTASINTGQYTRAACAENNLGKKNIWSLAATQDKYHQLQYLLIAILQNSTLRAQ